MSNHALNRRRTSLIFAAVSIAISLPDQLDAKVLEPLAWKETEFGKVISTFAISGGFWESLSTIRDLAKSNLTTRNMGVALGAVLVVFGGAMAALEFVIRPRRHNETGKASIKIAGIDISYIGAASFGVVVAGIITIILSFRYGG
jgi:hypothetical protein